MKSLLLYLMLAGSTLYGYHPAVHEIIFSNVQVDDEFLEDLHEQGIYYFFDDEGFLHVIMPDE